MKNNIIITDNHPALKKIFTVCVAGFMVILFALSGCTKLVEIDGPVNSINSANIFNSNATAAAVLTGMYTNLSAGTSYDLSVVPALSADELYLLGGVTGLVTQYIPFYVNMLKPVDMDNWYFTSILYNLVYTANSAIEGLAAATDLAPQVKQQLTGEAKFMRAFCYFHLVNFYGDIPLALTTDYSVNTNLSKTPKAKVFEQIIKDLQDAQELLSEQYLQADALSTYPPGEEERVRPTKWAAMALLARAYLYTGNWKAAEDQATLVIQQSSLYHLTALEQTFKKNNAESIWQLQPNGGYTSNTMDAYNFIPFEGGPDSFHPFYLPDGLVNSFEPGDQRKVNWVNYVDVGTVTYYYPFKYKLNEANIPMEEYTVVLRLAEQYLIRAEARAWQNNFTGAADDINIIRERAGLEPTIASSQEDLLEAVYQERRVELFTEWGHRWFDLKRTGRADAIMEVATSEKGGTWKTTSQLYPFSGRDMASDPNLEQNDGY